MKYVSLLFVLLFSVCQQTSEVKRFEISELGFSFEEPAWYGIANPDFIPTLKKYNWNVGTAITESTKLGGIQIIRYYKDSIRKDEKIFIEISVSGLHKNLQDFNKLLTYTRSIKFAIPDIKILQPVTETSVSGKRAMTDFKSYTETSRRGPSHKLFVKSLKIFMGTYTYSISMQAKNKEDVEVFDSLVKTISIIK